jgi:acyl-CoA synthetase (AMP-forming)/AMP-acid ligase II
MKVRGYQVAPAELEGCLLDHPDVSDACVVSVPDEYSGEVPLAFVVLSEKAAKRMRNDPKLTSKLKAGIMKVRCCAAISQEAPLTICCSTLRITKVHISDLQEVLSLWTSFQRTQAANC